MFQVNDDLSIYVTRGDMVFLRITADKDGEPYTFQPGELVRFKVFAKKDCEDVVLEKDFPVTAVTQGVDIILTGDDTKIGDVISKPRDLWYEVELNPLDNPMTIIGYDEDGAKVFKLFPEGADIPQSAPDARIMRAIDTELDMTSERPVQNQVIARAFANLQGGFQAVHDAVAKLHVTPQMFGAVGDGKADDTDALKRCIAYAEGNAFNINFGSYVYCVSSPLTVKLSNMIYGNNCVFKAIAAMDAVIIIDKTDFDGAYRGCSALLDCNVDGNALAACGIFVKYGKGITMNNIRVKSATNAQIQVCDKDQQVWELIVDNVELRSEYNGGYSPYGMLIKNNTTDSYFKNILVINSSAAWIDCDCAACTFEDIHGYGYPAELAADTGFVFRGNGNFVQAVSVDTPKNTGIIVEGDYNTFSGIGVGNMQSATGRGIEVRGTANTFDKVRCSTYYCFYITSGETTIDEFKCNSLFSRSEYDYFFTGKLPYRGVFDTKTEAKNKITRHFNFTNQWFYQSVKKIALEFGAELRYDHYNVRVIGVEESAPNYSLVKSTTGCEITCTDAITSGKKVNVVIDSPSIALI